eukprot:PhM_4_TR12882/c0_g1_i1/m.36460
MSRFSDSPSRLLSEITNFVLGGTLSPSSNKSSPGRSPCNDSHLETALLQVRAALGDLHNENQDIPQFDCGFAAPNATLFQDNYFFNANTRPFLPNKHNPAPQQTRAPRRALKDDLDSLAITASHTPGPVYFCLVEFKRQRVRLFQSSFLIQPSQYLVVGGDRGEDLGLCVWVWTYNPSSRSLPLLEFPTQGRNILEFDYEGVGCEVRRVASSPEIHVQNNVLPDLEVEALRVCREKCVSMSVAIDVIDVEYQYDRKKITFYFVADGIVDFRALVRDLWNHFNTRIWLERVSRVSQTSFLLPDH